MRLLVSARKSSVRVARLVAAGALAVSVMSVALPTMAGALGTTSTAPTPPDLFVAYAPLVSQGNTPGADTVESFDTATLATLGSPSDGPTASLGSAQVGAQPVAEAVSPDGGTVYVLNSASDSLSQIQTLASPPQVEATIDLPTGYTPTALSVTPDGTDAYVVGYPTVSNSLTPALWEIALTGSGAGTLTRTILLPASSSPAGLALTPDAQTALVTDYSGGDVIPVTLSSGKVGTPITVGAGPLGIAVSPNGNDAYVADSEAGGLTQIVLSNDSASPVKALETGYQPQEVAISPDGSTAWVTEDNASDPGVAGFVVPVEIPTLTPDSPIAVGYDPNGVAISPDGSTVYVADESNGYGVGDSEGEVTMIDTASDSASSFYTSIDPAAVVVTPDEAPVASFTSTPAPAGSATCFDASASYSLTNGPLTYDWNFGDGTVSPPSADKDDTICHTYLLPGTYQVTLDVADLAGTSTEVIYTGQSVLNNGGPSAGETSSVVVPSSVVNAPPIALVADSLSNQVTPILAVPNNAISPNDVGTPVDVGVHPDAIAIAPNGRTAYVANFGSDNVTPIDVATDTALPSGAWIPVGSEPDAIAITPNGQFALVANSGDGTVSKIALSTDQVVDTITVGGSPSGIAISPDGTTAYVTDNAPGYNDLIPVALSTDSVEPGIAAGTDPLGVAITPDGLLAVVVDRGDAIVPGEVTPISLPSGTPGSPVAVGNDPDAVAISSYGTDAYVANSADGTLSEIAISADSLGAVTTATTGADPAAVAVTPDGTGAYVALDQPGSSTSTGTTAELPVPAPGAVPTDIPVGAGADAVAITPDQAPVAALAVTPADAGEPSFFSAAQSTFPSAPVASYTWNFGDGSAPVTTTTDTTTHVYATGGSYDASVTVADADGTSTGQSFTGQTVSLNGGPGAEATATVSVPYVVPTVSSVSPDSGTQGTATSIIVTGANFFGVTSVQVGTTTLTGFTVNGAGTEISNLFVPSSMSAGSYDVTVTNPGGTSPVSELDVFTVVPTSTPVSGAPSVTAMSQGFGPESGGTGVTITGTNLSGATAVDFGSTPAASFTVNSAGTAITVTSPPSASAGTVDVTVTTPVATSQITPADAFTYLAPVAPSQVPTITGVSPSSGPTSGLTTVDITGTNLTGVTAVDFGSTPAESFDVSSSTELSAVSPAVADPGTVDITVTTVNGTSAVVPADAYTFTVSTPSAGPIVSSIDPSEGPVDGGNTVVIEGSGFSDLASSAVAFGGQLAAHFSVNSAGTKITAEAPGVGAPVSVDVTVTNPLGTSSIAPDDVYTYQPDDDFAPTITSVSPGSGPVTGDTGVTIDGTGLGSVTEVDFGSLAVTTFDVDGTGDQITVDSPVATAAGTVPVTVVNPYGTSAVTTATDFTYLPTNPPTTGPQVTSVLPVVGATAGGTGVTIDGTGFDSATAVDFGSEAAVSFTVNPAGTQITAVSPSVANPTVVDVTVTAGGDTSPITTDDTFTYIAGLAPPAPTITSVAPASGPITGGTSVTVTGTGLTGTLWVDFGATAGTSVVVNPTGTSLTVTSPAASAAGAVAVSLATPDGISVPNPTATFTYGVIPGTYHAVAPYRLLDTRVSGEGPAFGPGQSRDLQVTGVDSVPSGAVAVIVNLTVTDVTSATDETIWPAGAAMPTTVSLVAAKGETVAHLEEVPLSSSGAVEIFNTSGTAHVVVDLEGYVTEGTTSGGGFVVTKPALAYNTAAKHSGGPVVKGHPRKITLAGVAGVPATGVQAVLFYLTATGGTANDFATVYPAGAPEPTSSVLNWPKGGSVTNLVSADLGAGGAIDLVTKNGSANFTLVVVGYVTAPGAATSGAFTEGVDESLLFSGHVSSSAPVAVSVGGVDGVPNGASEAVVDVTVSKATKSAQLAGYAAGAHASSFGSVSTGPGQTVSTLMLVPIGTGGAIDLSISAGSATVSVALEGYCQ